MQHVQQFLCSLFSSWIIISYIKSPYLKSVVVPVFWLEGPEPPCWSKFSIFIGKNLLQLEFSILSLSFEAIFSRKILNSPQKKGNYLSGARCNWSRIKVFKTLTMSYKLSELLGHFMFFHWKEKRSSMGVIIFCIYRGKR